MCLLKCRCRDLEPRPESDPSRARRAEIDPSQTAFLRGSNHSEDCWRALASHASASSVAPQRRFHAQTQFPRRSTFVYCEPPYNNFSMAAAKNISISFQVSPTFNALLEVAAARENGSLTNMLETLVLAHCEQRRLMDPAAKVSKRKGANK